MRDNAESPAGDSAGNKKENGTWLMRRMSINIVLPAFISPGNIVLTRY